MSRAAIIAGPAAPGPPGPERRAVTQEYAMRFSYRQQRQFRLIEAAVCRSDPHLGAMFGIFGRLYPGQDLPGAEQLPDRPAGQGRLRRAAAWLVAALTTVAVAISVPLGKAVTTATARRRAPAPAPAAPREPIRPRSDGSAAH